MRKILALLLCLIMILSLVACGKKEDVKQPTNQATNATIDSTNNTKPADNTSGGNDDTIDNNLVYEDEDIRIVLDMWDFRENDKSLFVKMLATNKSDVELIIESDDESINSWTLLGISGRATIQTKEAAEFNLFCDSDCFGETGINTLNDIKELAYELTINKDGDRKYVDITMYPNEDQTYDFVGHDIVKDDIVLIDHSNEFGEFQIIYTGNSLYNGKTVYLDYYCVNTFNHDMTIEFTDIVIGEKHYSVTPKLKEILSNKELLDSCSVWADEDVVATNDTISFKIKIMDSETYQYIAETETFTININKIE